MKNFSNLVLSTRNTDDLISDIANEVISKFLEMDLFTSKTKPIEKNENDLITKKEALELLSISPSTLWRHEKNGIIKSYGFGGKRFYKRNELLECLTPLNN